MLAPEVPCIVFSMTRKDSTITSLLHVNSNTLAMMDLVCSDQHLASFRYHDADDDNDMMTML
jgi:hypothetical protein